MKVLHGTIEIANQMATAVKALNEKGVYAKSVNYFPNYLNYKSDYIFDINNCKSYSDRNFCTTELSDFFIYKFDIFNFHFGRSLMLDNGDLKRIRDIGKKTIMTFWGSDVRQESIAKKYNPYCRIKPGFSEDSIKKHLEKISPYIDVVICPGWELYDHIKDHFRNIVEIYPALNMSEYKSQVRSDNDFVIVHAPTDTYIKGSDTIHQTLMDLKSKYNFTYIPVMNVPHEKAKEIYSKADLIIDELHCGDYGLLSVECMAMGKPVITWICDEVREHRPIELPIISANPNTLKEKVIWALDNREELAAIGDAGPEYVLKYHDHRTIGEELIELYKGVA